MSGNYITRTFAFSDTFVNCGSIQTFRKLLFEYWVALNADRAMRNIQCTSTIQWNNCDIRVAYFSRFSSARCSSIQTSHRTADYRLENSMHTNSVIRIMALERTSSVLSDIHGTGWTYKSRAIAFLLATTVLSLNFIW